MGKIRVFLSSEDEDILIKNESITKFLNERAPKGCTIVFSKKHEDVYNAKQEIDYFKGSSLYVVDTHKKIDEITYWELGYALGSGLKVIGYYDCKSDKRISPDVERLINMPIGNANDECINHFKTMIIHAFDGLKPKENILDKNDYDTQYVSAKKEGGAT